MRKNKIKLYIVMHLLLILFSMCGISSKMASRCSFMSFEFCVYYGSIIVILGLYALVWQQIIKRLPLTTAYANRAVTVVWGGVWGVSLFGESITIGKIVGCIMVICGIILFAFSDSMEKNTNE